MRSIETLHDLEERFKQNDLLSREDFNELLILCTHRDRNIRETALTLLLHPPVADELSYYRHLIPLILDSAPKIAELPPAFVELVCDIIGFLAKVPDTEHLYPAFRRVLNHLPKSSLARLSNQTLPLRPFLQHIPVKLLSWPKNKPGAATKRKWRLLRKLLRANSSSAPAYELTWNDLKPIWRVPATGCCESRSGFRTHWRLIGRNILLAPVEAWPSPSIRTNEFLQAEAAGKKLPLPPLNSGYFGGFGAGVLRYLERLLQWQAKELAAVRELAKATSRNTRRVVLSWHNATLAAAGGWAFESLPAQFPSRTLWQEFKQAVDNRMHVIQKEQDLPHPESAFIVELWQERLVKPKIIHALWESRARASFDAAWQEVYEKHIRTAGSVLDVEALQEIVEGGKYGWHGTVAPVQRINFDLILNWANARQKVWEEGLIRLSALLQEGQKLVTSGHLPYLVLPWIDKFFISSRRTADLEYLPLIVNWLEKQENDPLVLFWEDTSHAQAPSFQLALKKMAAKTAVRGIGILDQFDSDRSNALSRICREHSGVRLFALRPLSDEHYPHSFPQLIRNRDYRFFKHYDSSWKDNLCFLYVGTQVFPLLSVQSDMEPFPAWIGIAGRKHPFGAYFRRRLRELTLGEDSEM
ncbi:MAG: hypothetical protein RBS57_19250, partial [Desulforhabdus sp.]|nr:hypothetical protein [Desulforhabdus sp.]